MNGTDNPIEPTQTPSGGPATHPATEAYSGEAGPGTPYEAPMPAARVRRVPGPDPRSKSPALACVLSAMPGLGQVYVGYYQRGFVHVIVVAVLISMLASDLRELTPLVALFMAFFWLYNIIDAGRRATLYNQALAGSDSIDLPSDFKMPRFQGSVFGGLLMIGFGLALLLNTRWGVSLDWVEEWWPVAPMLIGVWLIVRAVQDRREEQRQGP